MYKTVAGLIIATVSVTANANDVQDMKTIIDKDPAFAFEAALDELAPSTYKVLANRKSEVDRKNILNALQDVSKKQSKIIDLLENNKG